jgi:hypothetical protein
MDERIKTNVLTMARLGRDRREATGFFRVALGLYYLAGLMTEEPLDFAAIDRDFNRFIYHSLGRGHTITSVLQYMSGEKVLAVVESTRFQDAFRQHCPEVPYDMVPFLLSLNLGVAKNLSGLPATGPVADWIARQQGRAGPVPEVL